MKRTITALVVRGIVSRPSFCFSTSNTPKKPQVAYFRNNFLSPTSLQWIEAQYQHWKKNPSSVSPSFDAFFCELQKGAHPEEAYQPVPAQGQTISLASSGSKQVAKQLKIRMLIDNYRAYGHQWARTDPLDINNNTPFIGRLPANTLDLNQVGFGLESLEETFTLKNHRSSDIKAEIGPYTVKDMEKYLKLAYTNKIGFQYQHLRVKEERDFLKVQSQSNIQDLTERESTRQEQLSSFHRLLRDQCFIEILSTKFANFKRFGIQGLNAGTSALGQVMQSAAQNGVSHVVLGMAHRGRLNTLHCVFGKPSQTIFREFLEKSDQEDDCSLSGDVKYHLGYRNVRKFTKGNVDMTILANPSHLQAVNPVVYGTVRAIQDNLGDDAKRRAMGIIVHGDAAIAGQGIVYESLQMENLVDYSTGGIIHIVYNNQIGFTTNPEQARSSLYCTQVAKAVNAPVIHVNADQPDLIDRCIKTAVAYRCKFKKDMFIDIVGYRRHGHNEQDQPFFTQPRMYQKIKDRASNFDLYSQKLIAKGVLTVGQVEEAKAKVMQEYQEDYKKVTQDRPDPVPQVPSSFEPIKKPVGSVTGVAKSILDKIFKLVTTWPSDFNIHPTIKKIYEERVRANQQNDGLDWATMQSLSVASLLHDGYAYRLSGQDVERGTFSHRHALISDQKVDREKYSFLKAISPKALVCNSHLSEYGVTGFQYGYSVTNPNTLAIWQAQFGDFSNGAAIMIDNFIVNGQTKWHQQSGLVLSLPHGMDGQGPQHSSARMERYLQLSDDATDLCQKEPYADQLRNGNIQVVCCSTSSNYFHVLRRQMIRDYRKPLILFNSKRLLKFKGANRPLSDIVEGTQFKPVYADEANLPIAGVKKILLCNGQFYYDLKAKREQLGRKDIAIIRIQQLAPFPHHQLKQALKVYPSTTPIYWSQQQHQNYGPWTFLQPRLRLACGRRIGYYGRKASASTAVGMLKLHKKEEEVLLGQIFKP